jgi:hypothetical protein
MATYQQPNPRGPGGYQGGQRQGYQGRNDREMHDERPSFDVNRIEFKKRPEKPDPHLFSDCAEDAARAVADPRGQVNKSTQLRRFYDELVMWQEKVGSKDAASQVQGLRTFHAHDEGQGRLCHGPTSMSMNVSAPCSTRLIDGRYPGPGNASARQIVHRSLPGVLQSLQEEVTGDATMQLTAITTITATLELVTGLRIGAGDSEMHIGGVDNTVIKHPHTQSPYIPGSSLKGKMRSLLEWRSGAVKEEALGWKDLRKPAAACRPRSNASCNCLASAAMPSSVLMT